MSLHTIEKIQFADYELIDSGGYEKLERFGTYILSRPEPQAIWDKQLKTEEWIKLAHARFTKSVINNNDNPDGLEKGEWQTKPGMSGQWFINYQFNEMKIRLRLGLTSFKHVGVFPEQSFNWNYIFEKVKNIKQPNPKILNLFAYTGGASLAARCAGADVTHVDSVKQVINWGRENMEASGLDNIRWVVEDALKFVQREARRGNKYNGILLDPPKYGRGPDGEKWILEKNLPELLGSCKKILNPNQSFVVLNLYSMGFAHPVAQNLIQYNMGITNNIESGILQFVDRGGRQLPLGVFTRGFISHA